MMSAIATSVTDPRSQRASGWAAATLAVMVFGVVVVAVCYWQIRDLPRPGLEVDPWQAVFTIIPFGLAGAVLIDRRPDLPFGWLLAGGCVVHSVGSALSLSAMVALLQHGDRGPLVRWGLLAGSLLFVHLPVQGLINLRFPTGRPASRRARWLEIAIIAGTAVAVTAGFLGGSTLAGTEEPGSVMAGFENPLTGTSTLGKVADGLQILVPIIVLLTLAAGIGVVIRFFRAHGLVRQQLKWRAVHVLFAIGLFPLAVTSDLGVIDSTDNTLFVLTIAIPVLRYRLWAIDTILRRSAAYVLTTVVLAIGYVLVTIAGARLASERVGVVAAAVGVAAAFAPLRDRAQRLVDRVFYGERSDPYRTLSELGRRLQSTGTPGSVLEGMVQAIAESLRLPYVAIERAGEGTELVSAGQPSAQVERWPLTYEGQVRGFLVASPRRGEDSFDDPDRELLGDVARQAGVAVHAEMLTADLLLSRQRLVTAREEERRRLRRDLHDGLGPVLTSVGLNLDAARARLQRDAAGADELIVEARKASAQAITDLRRVVYALRPPALDDLGLVGALRSQAERLAAGGGLLITVESDDLPPLPAAVEVATYRTAIEALTNSARHSHGRHCRIRLQLVNAGQLRLEVEDDGPSDGDGWTPGVGLTSMRERMDELGGSLDAGPVPGAGAKVVATIPLPEATR